MKSVIVSHDNDDRAACILCGKQARFYIGIVDDNEKSGWLLCLSCVEDLNIMTMRFIMHKFQTMQKEFEELRDKYDKYERASGTSDHADANISNNIHAE